VTPEHLISILKQAGAKADKGDKGDKGDKEGWEVLPEGASLTLYLAHDGATLNVNRVESIRKDGELVYAKTKKDVFYVARADIFAIAIEGSSTPGQTPRRAGFG
jgi:hypothetical protein